jgi:hypothetical protein
MEGVVDMMKYKWTAWVEGMSVLGAIWALWNGDRVGAVFCALVGIAAILNRIEEKM